MQDQLCEICFIEATSALKYFLLFTLLWHYMLWDSSVFLLTVHTCPYEGLPVPVEPGWQYSVRACVDFEVTVFLSSMLLINISRMEEVMKITSNDTLAAGFPSTRTLREETDTKSTSAGYTKLKEH